MKVRAMLLWAAFLAGENPDLHNPTHPVTLLMSQLPGVDSFDVRNAKVFPTHRIMHLLNWHFLPEALFAADLRDASDEPIPDEEMDRRYAAFLDEVEAIQQEQMELIRHLICRHRLRRVFYEGFTKAQMPAFRRLANALRDFEKHKPKGETPLEQLLLSEYRTDLLRLGAPGRLMIAGELRDVLPVEDAALLEAANPVQEDGTIRLDAEILKRREDAIVTHLLGGGPFTVIVLGGAHDLADNVPRSCQYVRVKTKLYAKAAE